MSVVDSSSSSSSSSSPSSLVVKRLEDANSSVAVLQECADYVKANGALSVSLLNAIVAVANRDRFDLLLLSRCFFFFDFFLLPSFVVCSVSFCNRRDVKKRNRLLLAMPLISL